MKNVVSSGLATHSMEHASRTFVPGRTLVPLSAQREHLRGIASSGLRGWRHWGQGESLVPPYAHWSVSLTGGGAKTWCPLIHAKRFPLTESRAKEPGACYKHTQARSSLTGARAKPWCLLIHEKAFASSPGESGSSRGEAYSEVRPQREREREMLPHV